MHAPSAPDTNFTRCVKLCPRAGCRLEPHLPSPHRGLHFTQRTMTTWVGKPAKPGGLICCLLSETLAETWAPIRDTSACAAQLLALHSSREHRLERHPNTRAPAADLECELPPTRDAWHAGCTTKSSRELVVFVVFSCSSRSWTRVLSRRAGASAPNFLDHLKLRHRPSFEVHTSTPASNPDELPRR